MRRVTLFLLSLAISSLACGQGGQIPATEAATAPSEATQDGMLTLSLSLTPIFISAAE